MHNTNKTLLRGLGVLAAIGISQAASATTVSVDIPPPELAINGTTIYKANLAGIGLSSIRALTVTDSNSKQGGAPGIFSGFDVDGLFLDRDGSLATRDDRVFASHFDFSAGSTRATDKARFQPNAAHPGPTFGSLDAHTIDDETVTLNNLDASGTGNVATNYGELSLGDGGSLTASFDSAVSIGGELFLIAGEAAGGGEQLAANVTASDTPPGTGGSNPGTPVPAPGSLGLLALALGLIGLGGLVRRAQNGPAHA